MIKIKYISILITLSLFTTLSEAEIGLVTPENELKVSDNLHITTNKYSDYQDISKGLSNLLITTMGTGTYPSRGIAIIFNGTDTTNFDGEAINMNNIKIYAKTPYPGYYSYGLSNLSNNIIANNIEILSDVDAFYGIYSHNNENFNNNRDKVSSSNFVLNDSLMTINGKRSGAIFTEKTSIHEDSIANATVNNSIINLHGDSSFGLKTINSSINLNESSINFYGNTVYGMKVYSTGEVSINNNSTITSNSSAAAGIYLSRYIEEDYYTDDLEDKQTVTIDNNSHVYFKNAIGILTDAGNGFVNVNNGSSILSKMLIKTYAPDSGYENHPTNLTLNVSNGSTVTGYTLTADETTSSINLSSNSTWNVTENSVLTNLNATDSIINFKKDDDKFTTTTVDTLSGDNSTYDFSVDIVENKGSKLIINKSSSGDNIAQVENDGGKNTIGTEKILLVEDKSGEDAKATFKNKTDIELGAYKYEVRRDDENANNWVLVAKKDEGSEDPAINNTAKSITGLASSSYLLNQAELTTLRQRMGDLITDKTTSSTDISGVWGRVYGGRYKTRDNANLAKVNMNYYGFQLGGDMNTIKEGDDKNHLGVFIGHTTGKPDYVRGDSTVESWYGGLYDTFITEDNFYIDSVIKFGQYRNKYNLNDSQDNSVNGKVNSNVLTFSSEVGKRFILTTNDTYNLYLEPQAQLTWSRIGSFNTGASNGLNVKQDAYNSLISRLGASLGSQINKQSDVYLKASYLHEFKNDVKYKLNNSEESYNVQGNGVEIGIGGNVKLNENGYLYLEANYINSHAYYTGSKFNVGYRYSF